MKFSIIIPVYNAATYICDCLDSIISQNYKNIEIIIVDDGSIDNSSSIIKKYMSSDSRIKYYYQENNGVSSARNFGLKKASGDFIHFIDADDKIKQGLYKFLNDIIINSNCDFIKFNYELFNNDLIYPNNESRNNYLGIINNDQVKEYITQILDEKVKAYVWSIAFKRDLAQEFDTKLKILEDEVFFLDVLNKSQKIYITDNSYYLYNIGNENSATKSTSKIAIMMNNMLVANSSLKNVLKKHDLDNIDNLEILDSRMCHSFNNYLEILYRNLGSFRKAKNEFENIVKDKNLKDVFEHLNYKKLSLKHKITTFLILNKLYFLVNIVYYFKKGRLNNEE